MGVYLDRAIMLSEQGRHDLAEQELRQELAADPGSAPAHAFLALCLIARAQLEEATHEARQAVHAAPDLPFAHYALACVYHDRRWLEESAQAVHQALDLDPEQPDYFALLASLKLEAKEWQQALENAEEGLRLDPGHVGCTNVRAVALVKLGRRAEAGFTIDAALAQNPENSLTHANQGWTLLEGGHIQKAMEHFREALRLDPNQEWARQGIVEALKARNFLYRLFLYYFLWMAKLGDRGQWAVVLGGFVLYQVLRQLARGNPALAPWVVPVLIAYLVFVYFTWVADPLFNLMLRLNRFGRLALSPDQVGASNWVGAFLLLALVLLVVGLATGQLILVLAAAGTALLVIPIAGTFQCAAGWPRAYMAAYSVALGGVLAVTLALHSLNHPLAETLTWVFMIGFLASSFVANGLAMTLPRR